MSLAWSEVQHGIALEYHTVKGGGGECGLTVEHFDY